MANSHTNILFMVGRILFRIQQTPIRGFSRI